MNRISFIHIPKNGGKSILKICGKKRLRYYGHDVDVKSLHNQMIILRNPIDRFISSVSYAIQNYSNEPQIKYLILNGIDTPDKWVQAWSDSSHSEHDNLMREMLNNNKKPHKIGEDILEYKWTYSPQCLWFNNPKFIVIMDNFNKELQYVMKKHKINYKLPHNNKSVHTDSTISEKSKIFLMEFYKKDFELYEKYKNIDFEKILPIS